MNLCYNKLTCTLKYSVLMFLLRIIDIDIEGSTSRKVTHISGIRVETMHAQRRVVLERRNSDYMEQL